MGLIWRPGFQFDADASTYIEAVEAADEAASPGIGALETNTRYAINNFVIGCKQDGIWSAIKASCILAGARTLDGALVPLVGTAPTNYNFVAGDYNRETGLVGDKSTKYLDSNRACSSDQQDNNHICVAATARDFGAGRYLSGSVNLALIGNSTGFRARVHNNVINTLGSSVAEPTLIGVSRSSSGSYSWRDGGISSTQTASSGATVTGNYFVFSDNTPFNFSDARLSFYSIGEALDLAALDGRVTDLITAIGAAIP